MPAKKPVLQYDLSGRFVRKYDSRTEAAKAFGLNPSTIHSAVIGKVKVVGESQWRSYTEGDSIEPSIEAASIRGSSTAILQYSRDGQFLRRYSSGVVACRNVPSVYTSGISLVINGQQKTAGGFQWRLHMKGEPIPLTIPPVE